MDLLLHQIYDRVVKHQLLSEAKELLGSLQDERCSEPQPTHTNASWSDLQQLNKELSRLSLLGLVAGSSHENFRFGFLKVRSALFPAMLRANRIRLDGV